KQSVNLLKLIHSGPIARPRPRAMVSRPDGDRNVIRRRQDIVNAVEQFRPVIVERRRHDADHSGLTSLHAMDKEIRPIFQPLGGLEDALASRRRSQRATRENERNGRLRDAGFLSNLLLVDLGKTLGHLRVSLASFIYIKIFARKNELVAQQIHPRLILTWEPI